MAVSIIDENEYFDSSEYKPFNESNTENKRIAVLTTISATLAGAMNTSEIDNFRQGVEISTQLYRYKGFGPKIWAGNINGFTSVKTIGQAVSFTEHYNDKKFNDLLTIFNPVAYINLSRSYPMPLIFNDGPQKNNEASLQPFSIPFFDKNAANEHELIHAIRGSVEDGNQDPLYLNGRTNQIKQFIPFYEVSNSFKAFYDDGEYLLGDTVSGSIKIDGYILQDNSVLKPFDDLGTQKLLYQYNNLSTDMRTFLETSFSSSLDLDDDIRENYNQKSAPAGFDVYGPNSSRYNTDSITYANTFRGN